MRQLIALVLRIAFSLGMGLAVPQTHAQAQAAKDEIKKGEVKKDEKKKAAKKDRRQEEGREEVAPGLRAPPVFRVAP